MYRQQRQHMKYAGNPEFSKAALEATQKNSVCGQTLQKELLVLGK